MMEAGYGLRRREIEKVALSSRIVSIGARKT